MSEAPSVRDSLAAAMSGLQEAPAVAPDVQAPAPVEATPAAAEASPAPEATAAGAERDEHGRFKAKITDPAAPAAAGADDQPPAADAPKETETAKPADNGAQTEPTRVPPSLPAAVKAKFADLDPDVQQAFVKLEDSVQTAKAEWGRKGERLNRYDEIIGPHLDRWRLNGLDEYSGVQALIAAQNILERNPVEGLAHIARSYGVDLRALAGQALSQPTAAAPQGQPAMPELQAYLQPLVQQVQAQQQQLQQWQQQAEQQKLSEATAEVNAFMSDPKNLYFENVRQDVARLLDTGAAQTLQEAYDRAIWASPEIRPLLLAEQAKAQQADVQQKATQQAARQKAVAAQAAAGSVTGSPAPGAQAPQAPQGTLRDQLAAAYQQVNGAV